MTHLHSSNTYMNVHEKGNKSELSAIGSCPLKMWTNKNLTWTTNGPKQCNPKAVHIKMWTIQGVHIKNMDSLAIWQPF